MLKGIHPWERVVVCVLYPEHHTWNIMTIDVLPAEPETFSLFGKPLYRAPMREEIYETQKQGVPISHYAPASRVGKAYAEITKSLSNNTKKEPDSSKFE